jgi:hypothetical protein
VQSSKQDNSKLVAVQIESRYKKLLYIYESMVFLICLISAHVPMPVIDAMPVSAAALETSPLTLQKLGATL